MQLRHAIGFLVVGAVLGILPRIVPGWCPPTGVDGSSARELWLHVMSWLNVGLAGRYFGGRVLGLVALVMEYSPQSATAGTRISTAAVVRPAAPVVSSAGLRQPELVLEPALLAQG